MADFHTSPVLFVSIILATTALLAALGGWKSIAIERKEWGEQSK